ncbi:MAG: hypothetical protein E6G02_00215 [Actinobacteria bacterium]|jgi:hypothetical protein|nr:MAG: hypothetical protein E6G02_00215 [Actinomycetota bacterium]
MPLLSGTANHNLRQKEGSKLSRHFAPILAIACLLVVSVTAASAGTGNGAPSGAHYNLNIIGVSKDKLSSPMTDTQRHTIFVPLWGNCPIALVVGDFQVNDGNCTDADGSAEFQLPNPDVNNTGTTTYSVFARALGKPNGSSKMNTCATDPTDGSPVCSVLTLTLKREAGRTQFQNVSKYLLYIYTADGTRVPLFDSSLVDYLWSYDNSGLKLAQLRFYQCATIVPDASDPTGAQLNLTC